MIDYHTCRDLQNHLATLESQTLHRSQQGLVNPAHVRRVADLRAIAAFRLRPAPADPVEHARVGYAFMRRYLEGLADHRSTESVSITSEDGYTYTFRPRTVLRRVLDHALDHLNQIEQWVAWQTTGAVPTPTVGWASSEDTLDEDSLPLSQTDLSAWLWRIDIAWHMLTERAARLSSTELEWTPPGDDWNLARVLHHVAGGFYVVWLDNPLPEEPIARYSEASHRLYQALNHATAVGTDERLMWFAAGTQASSPEQIVTALINAERAPGRDRDSTV